MAAWLHVTRKSYGISKSLVQLTHSEYDDIQPPWCSDINYSRTKQLSRCISVDYILHLHIRMYIIHVAGRAQTDGHREMCHIPFLSCLYRHHFLQVVPQLWYVLLDRQNGVE